MSRAETMPGLLLQTANAPEAFPDFLIIAPPGEGSDWLARNLNCHPQIIISDAQSANKLPSGQGLMRGTVVLADSLVSDADIQRVHALVPKLKLIVIAREPDADCLSAWHVCFPRDRILVDSSSSIRGEPTRVLQRVFRFLGVNAINDFSFFKIAPKLGKHRPRTRDKEYFGHRLVYYKSRFFGIAHRVGRLDLRRMTEKEVVHLEEKGLLFRSPSLEWVQLHIAETQLAPLYRPPGKPGLASRARRYLLRRLGGFASAVAAKVQSLSPRIAARLKPAPKELRRSA